MKKTIHNVQTGEIYDIDLTDEEIALAQAAKELAERNEAEAEAKATAKAAAQAKLAALGLTVEDLQALGL